MKKNISEFENLIEPSALKILRENNIDEVEFEFVEPQTLLTPNRLDLAIKLKYIEARENNYDTKFFFELYKAHIRAFSGGTYTEPGKPEKNSLEKYLKTFHEIIDDVKNNGLDEKISIIPVNNDNVIINGSHRTAVAIYFNKKIPVVRIPIHVNYGSFFFRNMNLETEYLEYATATLLQMLNRPNFHVALLWPRAGDPNKVLQAEKILFEETDVIYSKIIPANYNLIYNLVIMAYNSGENDNFLGNPANNFYGAHIKAFNCYAKNSNLRIYFFYKKPSTDILQLKQKIRDIYQIGHDSIHMTDTKFEAERLTKILLNRNSMNLMKYGNPYKFFDLIPRLENFRKAFENFGVTSENFIVDSSSILGLYGLRSVGDIDYIPLPKFEKKMTAIQRGGVADNNSKYLPYYQTSAEDLVLNPRNYLWFNGMKFISLSRLKFLKKNRREADRGKDLLDILLTEKIFSEQIETVNKSVMEFLAYSHSAKNFNFNELIAYMEPIFFQEGWRVDKSLQDEKNILVICNNFEDDILKVENFLKKIRAENPLAKITFVANVQSQTLIKNLNYVDKILTLDQIYSQDIMWQICKIVELCRENLWQEIFAVCYIPNFEEEFRFSSLLAYLSGSFKRIGFIKNFQTVSEELKNFVGLLTKINVG